MSNPLPSFHIGRDASGVPGAIARDPTGAVIFNTRLPGGGIPAGGASSFRIEGWSFAYNTPGLVTGRDIYTPTVGDVIFGGWIEVETDWSTLTYVDVYSGTHTTVALFGAFGAVPQLFLGGTQDHEDGMHFADEESSRSLTSAGGFVRFLNTDPLKLYVNTTGTPSGADPGSTRGSARLYLAIATPTLTVLT